MIKLECEEVSAEVLRCSRRVSLSYSAREIGDSGNSGIGLEMEEDCRATTQPVGKPALRREDEEPFMPILQPVAQTSRRCATSR